MTPDADPIEAQRTAILSAALDEGVSPETADRIAAFAEQHLRQACGGRSHYLQAPSKAERNRAIRDAFRNGQRFATIAAEHGISETRVRQIVGEGEL